MKVVRLKKGQNDFALANLTLNQLRAIERALEETGRIAGSASEAGVIHEKLEATKLQTVQIFGDELVGKVHPRDWVKKSEREVPKHRDPNLGLKYSVNPLPADDVTGPDDEIDD
jgi:hypothetical protein